MSQCTPSITIIKRKEGRKDRGRKGGKEGRKERKEKCYFGFFSTITQIWVWAQKSIF
jgi:hypothetical protein